MYNVSQKLNFFAKFSDMLKFLNFLCVDKNMYNKRKIYPKLVIAFCPSSICLKNFEAENFASSNFKAGNFAAGNIAKWTSDTYLNIVHVALMCSCIRNVI